MYPLSTRLQLHCYLFLIISLAYLAALGPRCCAGLSHVSELGLSDGSLWLLFVGFAWQWLLLLCSTGSKAQHCAFSSCGTRVLWYVESSRTRDRTRVSHIGKWILYHWATREALHCHFSIHWSPVDSQHRICRNCLRIYILCASNSKTVGGRCEALYPWQRSWGRRLDIRKGGIEPQESPWKSSSIYPHNQSLPALLLCALPYTSVFTGGCPPPPLSEKELT